MTSTGSTSCIFLGSSNFQGSLKDYHLTQLSPSEGSIQPACQEHKKEQKYKN